MMLRECAGTAMEMGEIYEAHNTGGLHRQEFKRRAHQDGGLGKDSVAIHHIDLRPKRKGEITCAESR